MTHSPLNQNAKGDKSAAPVYILGATSDLHWHIRSTFDHWTRTSDIRVEYEPNKDFSEIVQSRLESDNPPDILLCPQPGMLADLAGRGLIQDLDQVVDRDELAERTRPGVFDVGWASDRLYGIPLSVNIKSLVWYPKRPFDRAGYTPPSTWDQLIELTHRIREEQDAAPWATGIKDAGATGWVPADWIKDLLLRTARPGVYEDWVAGKVPFDSPPMRTAFEMFADLILTPGNTYGGRAGMLAMRFPEAIEAMFTDPPRGWMQKLGSYIIGSFPDGARFGIDYDVFPLPPIEQAGDGEGEALLGGGDIAALVTDRREAAEVLRFMTTADWFRSSRAHEGGALSAFTDIQPADYPDPVDQKLADLLDQASLFRWDGSDRMPRAVGTGAFWTEVVTWIRDEQDLDTTLRRIDAAWPADRSAASEEINQKEKP